MKPFDLGFLRKFNSQHSSRMLIDSTTTTSFKIPAHSQSASQRERHCEDSYTQLAHPSDLLWQLRRSCLASSLRRKSDKSSSLGIGSSLVLELSHSVMSDSATPWTIAHEAPLSMEFSAGRLEWVAISYSKGYSWPRDQTHVSCIGRWILYHWATRIVSRIWF